MANIGWDANQVISINGNNKNELENYDPLADLEKVENSFLKFIEEFRAADTYKYREQLIQNIQLKYYGVNIELSDLISYSETLAQNLINYPSEYTQCFELAVSTFSKRLAKEEEEQVELPTRAPQFQIVFKTTLPINSIRNLSAESIGKLVKVSGIVISASSLSSKATILFISCKSCGHTKQLKIGHGITGIQLPRSCDNPYKEANQDRCPMDPFVIDHDKSTFVDIQSLKLQESPDMVPVGELPKHTLLSADRCLVNQVVPGTRTTILGIYSTFQSNKNGGMATRTPYIRIIGMESEVEGLNRGVTSFTDEEVIQMEELSRRSDFYNMFSKSIAPSIFGNDDIKKAITCLLFGGSTKRLTDGMRLRGDINVLMLGDPSTAKSQLLKFVEKVAPISVYTSGKGSSAAGLTASIVRDPSSREFYLEGGAMVLADGGVVCIDEFDKMRDEDRVAIHEAMEQQTISIAKAGITTMLNSRTSVLAAANPIFGRYDDLRTPGENIDFQTTILSRFDMIFLVRDLFDKNRDIMLAKHVMETHLQYRQSRLDIQGELNIDDMKRYIAFAKSKCSPRLNDEAVEELASTFVELRKRVANIEAEAEHRSAIPITIRQLEAIVRISESLAKMTLSPFATKEHVIEAVRLFKASTMQAIQKDEQASAGYGGFGKEEILTQMKKIEREVRNVLPIGSIIRIQNLKQELNKQNYIDLAIDKAIAVLVRQEVLQYRDNRRAILRTGH